MWATVCPNSQCSLPRTLAPYTRPFCYFVAYHRPGPPFRITYILTATVDTLRRASRRSTAEHDAPTLLSPQFYHHARASTAYCINHLPSREKSHYCPISCIMDRHHSSHQGERPLHGHHHASSNPAYPPPFHMSTAQPPTQIPFSDPFSRSRDPFLPGSHGRKGSLGPGPPGWPPAQGTFKSLLHKSELCGAGRHWRPQHPQDLIDVRLLRMEFRSDLQRRHETPARLRYLAS